MTAAVTGTPRVLVVEDEPALADLYVAWLADEYDVEVAHDGAEALSAVDETVDVVLLDRMLPGSSGDEVLADIRERGHDCHVIMVTAMEPGFDIVEMGFDGYVTKPIDAEELAEHVSRACARRRYEDLLQEYYALAEKRSTLEAVKSDLELESSEEYADLERRLEATRERLEAHLSAIDDSRLAAALERSHRVSALRERDRRHQTLTEEVLGTSRVGTVVVDAGFEVVWANAALERYVGLDPEAAIGADYREIVRERLAGVVEADGGFAGRVLTAVEANDGIEEFECHVVPDGDREERWLRYWSKPIEAGLYAGGRVERFYDVTPLKDRERTLSALHEATRDLVAAETRDEIADRTVETARAVLGVPLVALYLGEDASGELRPVAYTDELADAVDGPEPAADGGSRVFRTLVDGEATVDPDGAEFASELLLPLGTHGVLVLGDPTPGAFSGADVSSARVLAANAEVTLDRAAREDALRERDWELERRNEQLARLNRISAIVRGIGRALVDSSSRADIEAAVCDRLLREEDHEFVWIGEPAVASDGLVPRARAGDDGYLEELAGDGEESGPSTPAREALRTGTTRVVGNVLDEPRTEGWRSPALNRGFRSVAAVPLVYGESVYGVLEIYAGRPFAFGDEEREVLSELGETIGHAINAVKRKEALLGDAGVELELRLDAREGFFVRLAELVEGPVDLRSVTPGGDGSHVVYLSAPGASPEAVLSLSESVPAVSSARLVGEGTDEPLLRCRVDGETVVTTVAGLGAEPRSVVADRGGCRVVLELPRTTEVREFVDALSATYPGVSLLARHERPRSDREPRSLREHIDDRLTDRQREALQAAYVAGYFEWPRENDGRAIAEAMDIAQPTLQQHLRAGEGKLLEALFDGR